MVLLVVVGCAPKTPVPVVSPELALDRSTPEVAMVACVKAFSEGADSYVQCLDTAHAEAVVRESTTFALLKFVGLSQKEKARLHDVRAERWRAIVHSMALGRGGLEAFVREFRGTARDRNVLASVIARFVDLTSVDLERRRKTNRFAGDLDTPAMRARLALGISVKRTQIRNEARAWLLLEGKNVDGSAFTYSAYLVRHSDGWRLPFFLAPGARLTQPEGWPPTLQEGPLAEGVEALVAQIYLESKRN